jgi:hypothetical protein
MNARAMIRLNKRSFEKVAFKALVNLGNTMMNKEYKFLRQSYDRACGLGHNDKIKKWILDIDSQMTPIELMYIEDFIQKAKPEGRKILAYIPSKAGLHLITLPFDSREFQEKYPEIEIQRDNPTNLYIP